MDAGHDDGSAAGHDSGSAAEAHLPQGLMVSQDGYTFDLPTPTLPPGPRVGGVHHRRARRRAVTEFDVEHEKQLHLIAVAATSPASSTCTPSWHARRDLDRYPLDLTPGQWRLFADFKPAGAQALTLGTDLRRARRLPAGALRRADTGRHGRRLHRHPRRRPRRRRGRRADALRSAGTAHPVTDLQPYLGAYGHLVALREGDLAYLHVHPDGTPGDGSTEPGPDVVFAAAVPSAGRYQLYLDFQHATWSARPSSRHGRRRDPTRPAARPPSARSQTRRSRELHQHARVTSAPTSSSRSAA